MLKLRELRKQHNMLQREVAEKIGVERTVVVKWELGKSNPKLPMLIKLAELFNCSIDELLNK